MNTRIGHIEQKRSCWNFREDLKLRHSDRAENEPSMWSLYQQRWRAWVASLDVNEAARAAILAAGFQGAVGSVDGTYG